MPRDNQLAELKAQLDERHSVMRAEIRAELEAAGEERLAREVGDLEDRALASLLEGVRIADIERDVAKLCDIEAVFARMGRGDYGACEDCGEAVPYKRLLAFPTAKRCLASQVRFERRHGIRRASL